MVLRNLPCPGIRWIVVAGLFGLALASCESTYDSERGPEVRPISWHDPSSLSPGAERGRQLFEQVGCMGCHMVNGQGGQIGPNLSNEGNAGHSRPWLQTQIRSPKSHNPTTAMPAFDNLSDRQVTDLVNYLESLKTGRAQGGPSGPAPALRAGVGSAATVGSASVVATGARMWGRTCGECHNLRPPSEYSDAQWAVTVHHMRVRVPLTGQEQRDILAFLQATN